MVARIAKRLSDSAPCLSKGSPMTSTGMMIFLIGFYVLTSIVSCAEGNWPRVLYWISAAGITTAVLWGTR